MPMSYQNPKVEPWDPTQKGLLNQGLLEGRRGVGRFDVVISNQLVTLREKLAQPHRER